MAIPRKIFTYWINHDHNSMPDLVKRCIESQKIKEYEHKIITIEDCNIGSKYVDECLSRRDVVGYVKASDYMRVWYIWMYGGIAIDGDMEILAGKNFDHLLENKMFVPKDPQGHYGNAGFGSEKGDPLLRKYLDRVEENFRGSGELAYEPGIRAFSDMFYIMNTDHIKILSPDYFFPYNHLTNREEITENTLVKHWYTNSWVIKN